MIEAVAPRARRAAWTMRWRHLPLLLAVALSTLWLGFLLGQVVERRAQARELPGLADYQALVTFNHYSIVRAFGPSMEPALAERNFLLVKDIVNGAPAVQRGDILVSRSHGMHRIVGLPGETVWLINGQVKVCTPRANGSEYCRFLREPYVRYAGSGNGGPLVLRDGYAAVPDDRLRFHGIFYVPKDDVVGIARGSLLSYGPVSPIADTLSEPLFKTLVYEPPH